MKPYYCTNCGETDPGKFKGSMKGTCYECHKAAYKNRYKNKTRLRSPCHCQVCGTKDPANFYPNGGTRCKRCMYQPKPRQPKQMKEKPKPKYPKLSLWSCRTCGISGAQHFYQKAPFICKKCYNRKSTLYYHPYYDSLVTAQGGEFCYICKKTPQELGSWRLCVDHNHKTGLVRGLLCSACNFRCEYFTSEMALNLGQYLKSPPAEHLAIVYVEKKKTT